MGCSELSLPSTNSQHYWPESSVVKALMCRLWSSTSVQVLPWHFLIIWSSQIIGTKINVYDTFSRMNKIWYTKAWFPNQWPSEPWLNNVWQAFSYISEWMKDSVSSRSSDWRAVSLSPEKKGGVEILQVRKAHGGMKACDTEMEIWLEKMNAPWSKQCSLWMHGTDDSLTLLSNARWALDHTSSLDNPPNLMILRMQMLLNNPTRFFGFWSLYNGFSSVLLLLLHFTAVPRGQCNRLAVFPWLRLPLTHSPDCNGTLHTPPLHTPHGIKRQKGS